MITSHQTKIVDIVERSFRTFGLDVARADIFINANGDVYLNEIAYPSYIDFPQGSDCSLSHAVNVYQNSNSSQGGGQRTTTSSRNELPPQQQVVQVVNYKDVLYPLLDNIEVDPIQFETMADYDTMHHNPITRCAIGSKITSY